MVRVKVEKETPHGLLRFIYQNFFGRMILSILIKPVVSKLAGCFLSTSLSCKLIPWFIKKNNIDMEDYPKVEYKSFNDFFTRHIKMSTRSVDMRNDHFISPCDAKLSIYKIDEKSLFHIKGSMYSVASLLKSDILAQKYQGGYCLIFRLSVDDYHRYC